MCCGRRAWPGRSAGQPPSLQTPPRCVQACIAHLQTSPACCMTCARLTYPACGPGVFTEGGATQARASSSVLPPCPAAPLQLGRPDPAAQPHQPRFLGAQPALNHGGRGPAQPAHLAGRPLVRCAALCCAVLLLSALRCVALCSAVLLRCCCAAAALCCVAALSCCWAGHGLCRNHQATLVALQGVLLQSQCSLATNRIHPCLAAAAAPTCPPASASLQVMWPLPHWVADMASRRCMPCTLAGKFACPQPPRGPLVTQHSCTAGPTAAGKGKAAGHGPLHSMPPPLGICSASSFVHTRSLLQARARPRMQATRLSRRRSPHCCAGVLPEKQRDAAVSCK